MVLHDAPEIYPHVAISDSIKYAVELDSSTAQSTAARHACRSHADKQPIPALDTRHASSRIRPPSEPSARMAFTFGRFVHGTLDAGVSAVKSGILAM
jgi:hypothetical protein